MKRMTAQGQRRKRSQNKGDNKGGEQNRFVYSLSECKTKEMELILLSLLESLRRGREWGTFSDIGLWRPLTLSLSGFNTLSL